MRALLLFVPLLIITACGDGRWAPGYIVNSDGQMLANNDENTRAATVTTIVTELGKDLGSHWRIEAAIAELPVYDSTRAESVSSNNDGWLWPKATATITLIGDGTVDSPLSETQITTAVREYLHRKVDKPRSNLTVTTTRVVDANRFTAKSVAPATSANSATTTDAKPAVKPTATTTATQRYTVQKGDTWADLSQAFYGSTQHWRLLSDANQGGELTLGRELVIPPKP